MTLAIPYIRYSDPKQEKGASRERQQEITLAAIDRMGWVRAPFVEDLSRSAFHGEHMRSELGRLSASVLAGDYPPGTVIVAEKLDRLSRQGDDAFEPWLKSIVDTGVRIFTCDDSTLWDAKSVREGGLGPRITRMVKADAAREVIAAMQGRVVATIRKRQAKSAALGRPTSYRKDSFGVLPGWLEWRADKVEIIEHRADIVRDIYRLSADGIGSTAIARRLNETGRLPWGRYSKGAKKSWQPSSIYKLLESPTPEGDFVPTIDGQPGDKIVGYYPRIVEVDVVKAAREAKRRRRGMKSMGPSRDFINVFQGLVRCGQCNGRMHVQKCQDQKGVVRRYFRCDSAGRSACDRKTMFAYPVFEHAALDTILPLALDDRFFSRPDAVRPALADVATLEKLLDDQRSKSKRLVRIMLMTDDPDPVMVEEQADLRSRIASTQERLTEARAALDDARGGADQDAHLRRVLEVREAMGDDDLDTAMAARRAVRDAMGGVVETIISNIEPDGSPTMMVALVGGLIGFKVWVRSGQVTDRFDLTDRLEAQPQLRSGATSYRADGAIRLDAMIRRRG